MVNKSKVIIIENNKTHFNLLSSFLLPIYDTNDYEGINELIKNINQFCSNKYSDKANQLKSEAKSYLVNYFEENKNSICFLLDYQINEENGKEHINIDTVIELMKAIGITNFIVLSGKMDPMKRNDYKNKNIIVLEKIENWTENRFQSRQKIMKDNLIIEISKFTENLSDEEILKIRILEVLKKKSPNLIAASDSTDIEIKNITDDLISKINNNSVFLNLEILESLNVDVDYEYLKVLRELNK